MATLQVSVRPDADAQEGAYSIEQDTLQRIQTLSTHMLQRLDDSPPDLTVEVHRLEIQHTDATSGPVNSQNAASTAPAEASSFPPRAGIDQSETPDSYDVPGAAAVVGAGGNAAQTPEQSQHEELNLGGAALTEVGVSGSADANGAEPADAAV